VFIINCCLIEIATTMIKGVLFLLFQLEVFLVIQMLSRSPPQTERGKSFFLQSPLDKWADWVFENESGKELQVLMGTCIDERHPPDYVLNR
jgi:hypothetical protein